MGGWVGNWKKMATIVSWGLEDEWRFGGKVWEYKEGEKGLTAAGASRLLRMRRIEQPACHCFGGKLWGATAPALLPCCCIDYSLVKHTPWWSVWEVLLQWKQLVWSVSLWCNNHLRTSDGNLCDRQLLKECYVICLILKLSQSPQSVSCPFILSENAGCSFTSSLLPQSVVFRAAFEVIEASQQGLWPV